MTFSDVLGGPCTRWLSCTSNACRSNQFYLTQAQVGQIGAPGLGCLARTQRGPSGYDSPQPSDFLSTSEREALGAALVHSRPWCRVHPSKGDVLVDFDVKAAFLSIRGSCIYSTDDQALALTQIQNRKQYSTPFWVSLPETKLLHTWKYAYGALHLAPSLIESTFSDAEIAPEVVNDRGIHCRVLNLEEVQVTPFVSNFHFHLFRRFTPMSVRTRLPFSHDVTDRIRAECCASRCWCSVWGTLEDFVAVGVEPLQGALGVWVLDALGNEVFLTNAMCTKNPRAAYQIAYPNHIVVIM